MLGDQLRLETAVTVTWNIQCQPGFRCQHGLLAAAVLVITQGFCCTMLMFKMVQLGL
jgi:hypothetical protein